MPTASTLFWRGALQNLTNPQAPFLPGSPPEQTIDDHSKGFALGYTAVLSPTIVNTFHLGIHPPEHRALRGTRNQQHWNVFYGLDQGFVYGHNAQTPMNNLLDDFSWTKGKHTLQFGGNLGFVHDPRLSYEHSFSVGKGATNWMSPTGFANTERQSSWSPLQSLYIGLPEPGSTSAYDHPVLGLLGMVSDLVANYNYDKQRNSCPRRPGEPELRDGLVRVLRAGFLAHEAESYADLWRTLVAIPAALGSQRLPGNSPAIR